MDKKTLIFGLIIIIGLVAMVTYFQKRNQKMADQAAFVLESAIPEEIPEEVEEATEKIETEFILGSPEAPVTIIEYYSHLCGHCSSFNLNTLPLIIDKYVKTGKVKIIPRPLSPFELDLAILCAHEQSKFWQFNEYLFGNITNIDSIDKIKEAAKELQLDQDSFNQCLDTEAYGEGVKKWFDQAEEDKVEGVPHFIINDQHINGNQPFTEFERVIEEELIEE